MKLVIIESPYAGDIELHERYARACMRDSILRGEAPLASHLLYTQPGILDDGVPTERGHGIGMGFAWARHADCVVFYWDLLNYRDDLPKGMLEAQAFYKDIGVPMEDRNLPKAELEKVKNWESGS